MRVKPFLIHSAYIIQYSVYEFYGDLLCQVDLEVNSLGKINTSEDKYISVGKWWLKEIDESKLEVEN